MCLYILSVYDPIINLLGHSIAISNEYSNSSVPIYPVCVKFEKTVEQLSLITKVLFIYT